MRIVYPGPGVPEELRGVSQIHPLVGQLDPGVPLDVEDGLAELMTASGLVAPAPTVVVEAPAAAVVDAAGELADEGADAGASATDANDNDERPARRRRG